MKTMFSVKVIPMLASVLLALARVYTLERHEAELDKYAAQKVTVKGTVKGQSLTVESVIPAK